jgi:hypothetical protein
MVHTAEDSRTEKVMPASLSFCSGDTPGCGKPSNWFFCYYLHLETRGEISVNGRTR